MVVGAARLEIETPALLVDLDVMESNIAKMSDYFKSRRSKLRAHAKTHKSPLIAHKQIAAGAGGICCQKLGEAEVMINSGIRDILITSEIVEPAKIERLVRLSRYSDAKVVIDNIEVARKMSETAQKQGMKQGVLVELDIRNKRCGTVPGKPTVEFVKEITKLKGLNFRGLMEYEGPFLDVPDFQQRRAGAHKLLGLLRGTVELVRNEGIPVDTVSAGSTGTYNIAGEYPEITEVEAGSYVFMDSTYQKLEGLNFGCALTVLATVISRPVPERIIVDAGWKATTQELGMPLVKNIEGARFYHFSEEHGSISVDPSTKLSVGDKVALIPSHCCTTVNLHDFYYGIRNGHIEAVWPISARGKFL